MRRTKEAAAHSKQAERERDRERGRERQRERERERESHTLFKHSPAYLNQSADESSMNTSVVKRSRTFQQNGKMTSFFLAQKKLISATPEMRRNAKKTR